VIDLDLKKHIGIFGFTGSGKSMKAGWMFEQLRKQNRPFVLFDTKVKNQVGLCQMKGVTLLQIAPGKQYDWKAALKKSKYIVCTPVKETKRTELISQYEKFAEYIFTVEAPRTIGIEEAHLWNPSGNVANEILENISREGRAYNQNLICIDQRIQSFPKDLWSQCATSILCKVGIPQDIEYLRRIIPDYYAANLNLPDYGALIYDHKTGRITGTMHPDQFKRITPHLG